MSLHEQLEAAFSGLARPVSSDAVLSAARATLPPAQFKQFEAWMKSNATPLLERLNG